MVDFLEEIQSNPVGGIVVVILFVVAIQKTTEFIFWALEKMNIYHKKKSHEEKLEEMITEINDELKVVKEKRAEQEKTLEEMLLHTTQNTKRLESLSSHEVKENQVAIVSLKETVEYLKECLDTFKEENTKQVIASCSSILYRLYQEGAERGYTDKAALESFSNLADIYLKNGGNSSFKHKIIPQYYQLPIKDLK